MLFSSRYNPWQLTISDNHSIICRSSIKDEKVDTNEILHTTRTKSGLDTSASSRRSTPEQHSKSYKSLGSSGSGGSLSASLTNEEKNVAGGLSDVSPKKLKSLVKQVISSKRMSDIAREASERSLNVHDGLASPSDPDLVAPPVVLELWKLVADGAVDGSGKYSDASEYLQAA